MSFVFSLTCFIPKTKQRGHARRTFFSGALSFLFEGRQLAPLMWMMQWPRRSWTAGLNTTMKSTLKSPMTSFIWLSQAICTMTTWSNYGPEVNVTTSTFHVNGWSNAWLVAHSSFVIGQGSFSVFYSDELTRVWCMCLLKVFNHCIDVWLANSA